ncbi:MAG TPA: hypothetical protein VFJ16_14235 [Longimicrobium sp.]|nr:hypothetical protein [Longimicrobium sp.]
MPIRIRLLATVLGAVILAACGDQDPSGSEFVPTVHFSYSGAASGSFGVTAPRPATVAARQSAFVEGITFGGGSFVALSLMPTTGGRGDWVTVMGTTIPGEYDLASTGCTQALCAQIGGSLGQSLDGSPREGEMGWHLDKGTLTVRRSSVDGRVRGTFSGSGLLLRYAGGSWTTAGRITVGGGSFEADLKPAQPSL